MASYLDTEFEFVVETVRRLNRGQRIFVDRLLLRPRGGIIGEFLSNGATPADEVLEKIIGSSYELGYSYSADELRIEFFRLHDELPDGVRSFVSVDRRHHFERSFDGMWRLRGRDLTHQEEYQIQCAKNGHHWHTAYVYSAPPIVYGVEKTLRPDMLTVVQATGYRCFLCNKEKS